MQRLEVSGAVRHTYMSLGGTGLINVFLAYITVPYVDQIK
jgi:hypothetical protein